MAAVVVLPQALLPKAPPASSPPPVQMPGDAPTLNLPGSVAEANSNALPPRSAQVSEDPLIAAAERTVLEAGTDSAPAAPAAPEEPAHAEPVDAVPADAEPTDAVPADAEPAHAVIPSEVPAPEEPENGSPESDSPEADDSGHAESEAETTMQVRLPVPQDAPGPYAIGPDSHERAADTSPAASPSDPVVAAPVSAADVLPGPRQPMTQPLTDKGLPKRTPKVVTPAAAPVKERKGGLDRDALRRRLGGFQQGARDGRRDVEAEIAGSTDGSDGAESAPQTDHIELDDRTDGRFDETGDTVEEARS